MAIPKGTRSVIALFIANLILISKLAEKHDPLFPPNLGARGLISMFPQTWGLGGLSRSPREIGKPTDTLQLIAEQNCAMSKGERLFAPAVSTVD